MKESDIKNLNESITQITQVISELEKFRKGVIGKIARWVDGLLVDLIDARKNLIELKTKWEEKRFKNEGF